MRILILLIGIAAGALGFVVMFGWILRLPSLVQVLPGSSAMVLATAFAFLLSGTALGLIGEARARVFARSLAIAVCALAAGFLAEHAFGVNLGLDLSRLHDWLADGNPVPGRMSAFTAGAFLAFGGAALALCSGDSRATLVAAMAAGWFVIVVGAVNLLGYVMRLEDLFVFLQANRMAPHTSAGAIALGAGLLLAVQVRMRRVAMVLPAEQRITATSVGLLALAAMVSGGAVFALMQQNLQQSAGAMLLNMLEVRQTLLLTQLDQGRSEVGLIVSQPALHRGLRARDEPGVLAAINGFVGAEFSGVAVHGADGRELARAGQFAASVERRHRMASHGEAEIIASGKAIYLRLRTEIRAGGGSLGTLVSDQPLVLLSRFMAGEGAHGATGEMALCHGGVGRMWCFPQRLNPRAFDVARQDERGARLPMAYALDGATGFVRTRDYRGQNVLAAHGPVGDTGLGIVVKVDTAELFAPVRAQLGSVLLAALATVMLGAWLLRRRVQPLVVQMSAAEADAREAHDRLQKIADNVPALVGYMDADTRYLFANRTYDDWFGIRHEDIVGKLAGDVWDAERNARSEPQIRRALAGERVEFERTVPSPRGERVLRSTYVPDIGEDGKVAGFFILSSDITEAQNARRALDRAMQRLDLALDASRVTVWETDLRTGETVLSEAWAELLDRPPGETRTTVAELGALVHPAEIALLGRESMDVVKGKREQYAVEHRVRAASGHWKWILSRGKVVERDPATGAALRMMGTNLDITARKQGELRLEQLANYDGLTGAANRNLFKDRLAQAVARSRRSKVRGALMYLDIDKFKGINDTLGHAAGDALLKEFAARLKASVRATDTVGRLGGDEFSVLLEDVKDDGAPGQVAQKILEAMRVPVDADGRPVTVTTSIGVALFDGTAECDALAKRADAALYEAKAAGRNCFRLAP